MRRQRTKIKNYEIEKVRKEGEQSKRNIEMKKKTERVCASVFCSHTEAVETKKD